MKEINLLVNQWRTLWKSFAGCFWAHHMAHHWSHLISLQSTLKCEGEGLVFVLWNWILNDLRLLAENQSDAMKWLNDSSCSRVGRKRKKIPWKKHETMYIISLAGVCETLTAQHSSSSAFFVFIFFPNKFHFMNSIYKTNFSCSFSSTSLFLPIPYLDELSLQQVVHHVSNVKSLQLVSSFLRQTKQNNIHIVGIFESVIENRRTVLV